MSLLPTSLPQAQATDSKTFFPAPLDGSLTLPEVFEYNLKHSPSHPLFVYESDDKSLSYISWKDVVHATHRAARIIKGHAGTPPSNSAPIIGLLASSDSVTYFSTIHGIIRAGFQPFPISPRNSPAAVSHLLSKTNVEYVLVSQDKPMQGLVNSSLKELATTRPELKVKVVPIPKFLDLYPVDEDDFEPLPAPAHADLDASALILHSSGSTAFPKPIHITHRILVQWLRIPWYGEMDLCSETMAAVALPMFHALGVIVSTLTAASGLVLAVFKPGEPTLPSPEKVFHGLVATKSTLAFAVPSFIETWSQDPATVETLANLKALIFSGGPLSKTVGDALSQKGVPLTQVYGITEVGSANTFIAKDLKNGDWEYFKISPQHDAVFASQNDEAGAVEFQVFSCETHTPAVLNLDIDGRKGYATNDLLIPHPTKQGYYKIFGRADDQIMLSTGEKTNPGPLETIIGKDPRVAGAVMFGRGRFQNGVIIQPAKDFEFDPTNSEKKSEYINSIWSSVEQANAYAPSHSRLFKEMIIITPPSKPFTFTAKGSVRRGAAIEDYKEEIEAIYTSVEESSQAGIEAPAKWDKDNTVDFVRRVVFKVLEREIKDEDDIFQQGGDSLQATWIRNSITHTLREAKFSTKDIPQNFVYTYPTVAQLGDFVYSIVDPTSGSTIDRTEAKINQIQSLIQKYTANFPVHRETLPAPSSDVILLTGTTGGLGTTVLAELIQRENVSKIYAFNRPDRGGKSLRKRQEKAFAERGVDVALLDSSKVVLVEGNTSDNGLGIPIELYAEIRDSVTSIVHNAWRVDFNIALSSFEPLIQGLRNLIDLALQSPYPSPARLLFASSVSILGNWHSSEPAEESTIKDVKIAVGNGYGESKYVAESILEIASQKTPLRPVIARIGQLSGGTNGSWNTSEWLPAIVRSGEVLGCLPSADGDVSWLPLKHAGSAIIEMQYSPHPVVHLTHPRPVSWSSIFQHIAEALKVPIVPYEEWFSKLESSGKDANVSEVDAAKRNPALLLVDSFRAFAEGGSAEEARDAMGVPKLGSDKALEVASSLAEHNLPQLGQEDAEKWVAYWRKAGLLESQN